MTHTVTIPDEGEVIYESNNLPYTPGKRRRRMEGDVDLQELYDFGLTDAQMVEALMTKKGHFVDAESTDDARREVAMRIRDFRERHDLEENFYDPQVGDPFVHSEDERTIYTQLYGEGLYDAQIARRTGTSRGSVWHWRNSEGFPPNRRQPTSKECMMYYRMGKDDNEIAELTGLKPSSVRHWRFRHKKEDEHGNLVLDANNQPIPAPLPAVSKLYFDTDAAGRQVKKAGTPDYGKYWEMGMNDVQIGAMVNRSSNAVYSWRRRHGKEPRGSGVKTVLHVEPTTGDNKVYSLRRRAKGANIVAEERKLA